MWRPCLVALFSRIKRLARIIEGEYSFSKTPSFALLSTKKRIIKPLQIVTKRLDSNQRSQFFSFIDDVPSSPWEQARSTILVPKPHPESDSPRWRA